jgi:hypothetical protein
MSHPFSIKHNALWPSHKRVARLLDRISSRGLLSAMDPRKASSRPRGLKRTKATAKRAVAPSKAGAAGQSSRSPRASRRPTPGITKHRLFVIGAGASYAAGLPDANHLSAQLYCYIGNAPWEVVHNRPPSSYFNALDAELHQVLKELSTGGPQGKWPMDAVFERFGELVAKDPQRFGEASGKLFEATAQLLYHRSLQGAQTEAYHRFVQALTEDDLVLSFNWDVCLEIAMQRAGGRLHRALRLPTGTGPWLLKLNGSIDHLVVNTSTSGIATAPGGKTKDRRDWWTQFPFLDVGAPSPPGTTNSTSP